MSAEGTENVQKQNPKAGTVQEARPLKRGAIGGSRRERLDTVKQLLRLFRLERLVYLGVTLTSVVVLLTCAIVLLVRGKAGIAEIIGLFGSTGGITYSTGRLLKMWGDAIRILQDEVSETPDV